MHLKKKKVHFLVTGKYSLLDQPGGLSNLRLMQKEFYHGAVFIRKEKGEWVDEECQTDHVFFLKRIPTMADKLVWK